MTDIRMSISGLHHQQFHPQKKHSKTSDHDQRNVSNNEDVQEVDPSPKARRRLQYPDRADPEVRVKQLQEVNTLCIQRCKELTEKLKKEQDERVKYENTSFAYQYEADKITAKYKHCLEFYQSLKKAYDESKAKNKKLEDRIEKLEGKNVQDLEEQNAIAVGLKETVAKTQSECDSLILQMEAFEARAASADSQIEKLKKDLDISNKYGMELSNWYEVCQVSLAEAKNREALLEAAAERDKNLMIRMMKRYRSMAIELDKYKKKEKESDDDSESQASSVGESEDHSSTDDKETDDVSESQSSSSGETKEDHYDEKESDDDSESQSSLSGETKEDHYDEKESDDDSEIQPSSSGKTKEDLYNEKESGNDSESQSSSSEETKEDHCDEKESNDDSESQSSSSEEAQSPQGPPKKTKKYFPALEKYFAALEVQGPRFPDLETPSPQGRLKGKAIEKYFPALQARSPHGRLKGKAIEKYFPALQAQGPQGRLKGKAQGPQGRLKGKAQGPHFPDLEAQSPQGRPKKTKKYFPALKESTDGKSDK